MDGPDQPVGARREAPCRCLPQASDAGSGKGLGGDCLRKDEVWHEEDRENCKPIPALIGVTSRNGNNRTLSNSRRLWRCGVEVYFNMTLVRV